KAEVGLGVRETPLDTSFCAHALLEQDFLLVPDATADPRFACNPLVTGEPHIRFYAGALLKTDDGLPIGTLCVLDYQP
ncbi:histidine kinase, partial [Stenotrophomonas maltophilia]